MSGLERCIAERGAPLSMVAIAQPQDGELARRAVVGTRKAYPGGVL